MNINIIPNSLSKLSETTEKEYFSYNEIVKSNDSETETIVSNNTCNEKILLDVMEINLKSKFTFSFEEALLHYVIFVSYYIIYIN